MPFVRSLRRQVREREKEVEELDKKNRLETDRLHEIIDGLEEDLKKANFRLNTCHPSPPLPQLSARMCACCHGRRNRVKQSNPKSGVTKRAPWCESCKPKQIQRISTGKTSQSRRYLPCSHQLLGVLLTD